MQQIWQSLRAARGYSFIFALMLLVLVVIINASLQANFFERDILSGNLRTYMPLMILAVGQAIVIIGGGIDLSIGAIVSLANVVAVQALGSEPSAIQIIGAILSGLAAAVIAGAFNGVCVAYGRLQPIVTTFATSFVIAGCASLVMPTSGGSVPEALLDIYKSNPLDIPLTIWVAAALIGLWMFASSTRYHRYLYAIGSDDQAAYITGVPVARIRMGSYMASGFFAGCAGLALMLSTSIGDPLIGNPMTLPSIVAVVLGGTRLSGGQGGITGAIIGVFIVAFIRSIITFADVPTWWQTLVDSLIILVALAGPGVVNLLRRQRRTP